MCETSRMIHQQLIERFEATDSSITLHDYALIYYGHSSPQNTKGVMERWKEREDA